MGSFFVQLNYISISTRIYCVFFFRNNSINEAFVCELFVMLRSYEMLYETLSYKVNDGTSDLLMCKADGYALFTYNFLLN